MSSRISPWADVFINADSCQKRVRQKQQHDYRSPHDSKITLLPVLNTLYSVLLYRVRQRAPVLSPIDSPADYTVSLNHAHEVNCSRHAAIETWSREGAAKEGCSPNLDTLPITTARNSGLHYVADTSIVPKQIKIIPKQSSLVIFSRRKSHAPKARITLFNPSNG
jgi:hypothetical protein